MALNLNRRYLQVEFNFGIKKIERNQLTTLST